MLFGRIVASYARVDAGLRHLLAAMLHLPLEMAMLVAAPYGTRHMRNVTRAIAKIVLHDEPKLLAAIIQLLGDHKSLDRLRNDISHNMWSRSPIEGRIRPWHVDVADGKAMFSGFTHKPRDYSDEDLRLAANLAVDLNHRLIALIDSPELAEAMAKKTDLMSLDTDAILGISSNAPSGPSSETQEPNA